MSSSTSHDRLPTKRVLPGDRWKRAVLVTQLISTSKYHISMIKHHGYYLCHHTIYCGYCSTSQSQWLETRALARLYQYCLLFTMPATIQHEMGIITVSTSGSVANVQGQPLDKGGANPGNTVTFSTKINSHAYLH